MPSSGTYVVPPQINFSAISRYIRGQVQQVVYNCSARHETREFPPQQCYVVMLLMTADSPKGFVESEVRIDTYFILQKGRTRWPFSFQVAHQMQTKSAVHGAKPGRG